MSGLRPIHHKKFHKFLLSVGCEFVRSKGSHFIYQREDLIRPIVIPAKHEIPIFVILNNLRLLNITKEKYLQIIQDL